MNRKLRVLTTVSPRNGDTVEGGWDNIQSFGVCAAVVYCSELKEHILFDENHIDYMVREFLLTSDLVIGFNSIRYDYEVLNPYTTAYVSVGTIPTFDILHEIQTLISMRVSMDNLSKRTFDRPRHFKYEDAAILWNQGKLETIQRWCLDDNSILLKLFIHGCKHKYLEYWNHDERRVDRINTESWIGRCVDIMNLEDHMKEMV